jgi:hypothetical protein
MVRLDRFSMESSHEVRTTGGQSVCCGAAACADRPDGITAHLRCAGIKDFKDADGVTASLGQSPKLAVGLALGEALIEVATNRHGRTASQGPSEGQYPRPIAR